MSAFSRISLRHFGRRKARVLFTIGGIALGVASMVGMQLLHDGVSRSFEHEIEELAGKAVLEISNGTPGVPEELLEEVQKVPGVSAAAASVHGFVPIVGLPGERLYVFGIDLLADQELREYDFDSGKGAVEDPILFLAQADSVALTSRFLDEHGLKEGDRVRVQGTTGIRELTIRGRLDIRQGPATLFDGRIAVMDIFAAQRLLGLDRRFSQIDLGLKEGVTVVSITPELTQLVGARGTIGTPVGRSDVLDRLLESHRFTLTLAAGLAVVVGLYLIFNTMMIAVAERRREIGALRALGMRRTEVARLFGLEALILGVVASVIGVPLGLALARGLSAGFASTVSFLYAPVEAPAIGLRLGPVLWGAGLGILSTLLAVFLPVREAVRVHPLEAMRRVDVGTETGASYARVALIGVSTTALALGWWLGRSLLPFGKVSACFVLLALLVGPSLAAPAVTRVIALRADRLLARIFGPLGALAAHNLVTRIRRVAPNCAALVVSLGGAIAVATMLSSLEWSLGRFFASTFEGVDLIVSSAGGDSGFDVRPLPGAVTRDVAGMPDVAGGMAIRFTKVSYDGSLVVLRASDRWGDMRQSRFLLEGDPQAALDAFDRGNAVWVNESFLLRHHHKLGDVVSLGSPGGALRLPIAAVFFDTNDLGMIDLDGRLYRRLWRDDAVSYVMPAIRPGVDRTHAIDDIRTALGDRYDLSIVTLADFRRYQEGMVQQILALFYPVIAIAIGVALLGVMNSLYASILDRTREIGLLRALGATRRQVVRSVMIESGMIGLISATLALAVGSALGVPLLDISTRAVVGMSIFYRYPVLLAAFAFVAAIALAIVSGLLPGRAAARLKVDEALEYE